MAGNQAFHGKPATGISLKLRQIQKIGTWNVRGLLSPGKLEILEEELARCGINMCGLCKTHWKNSGHLQTKAHIIFFSGNPDSSRNGVALALPLQHKNCVLGYEPVNDRIISVKLKASPVNLNIVQVYAPTSQASDEIIEDFYTTLEATIDKIPNRECLVILGDFNAKIGANAHKLSASAGRFGLGQRNDRGERLIQFAAENDLVISNSQFQHHPRRLWTWISPDGQHRN
ncbi:hypothetical protein PYW07_017076 [Mythimna separata]|uniref:Endonuclease/exonuclease/phosphatase domain-containing protein n=1 Tax=Mythimna separata TaxID=271217 RepID=A0AAD8DXC9_MYTSE|nr:hypothetical protein PYW07_017076 [Mythimna separata]